GPICSLVGQGMGISVLDHLTAAAYADHNVAIRPFSPSVPCELKLVLPSRQKLSEPAQAMVDIAKSVMSGAPPSALESEAPVQYLALE
ncbi:LysR substrate-binding domain-containing protein, partial [Rhizobiaceae bacterium]|nr:LysR substrate-binding domain-containing protein [Rhizobiaceae bacterium]